MKMTLRTVQAGLELIAAATLHKSSASLQSGVGIAYAKRAATLLQSKY
jgi:hypothetical protein